MADTLRPSLTEPGIDLATSASAQSQKVARGRRHNFTVIELALGLLALGVLLLAGKILLLAFGGLLLAVFLSTLSRLVSRLTRLPYTWAFGLVVLVIVLISSVLFLLVGNRLALQVSEFAEAIPRGLKQIQDGLSKYVWGDWIIKQSPEWAKAIAQGDVPARLTNVASTVFDFLVSLIIILFVGLYCAAEPTLYVDGLTRLFPLARRPRVHDVFEVVVQNLRWWLLGQVFAMVCVGVITGVGVWLVGAPLALTLGVLAAAFEILPNIGPLLWLAPALLVALPQGSHVVISVVAVYAVTHTVESYVLIPLVQRRTVWLPPALSILSMLLLGVLAGVLGLLVAAPLSLVMMLLVKMLYVEDHLGDQIVVPGEAHVDGRTSS